MNQSESISTLAAALVRAQAEMVPAPFDATNPFLKNRYASLGSVIETARPTLARHGLSFMQMVSTDGLTTRLLHESGEWIEETMALELAEERGKSNMQALGSAITYARRYALSAMLGIYADEDTDANQQQVKPAPRRDTRAETSPQAQAERDDLRPQAEDGKVADFRAKLQENGPVTWATVASAVMAVEPHYQDAKHVYNALNGGFPWPVEGYEATGGKRVKPESAVKAYDWLLERVSIVE